MDAARLAEAVQATVNGTRLLWAVMQDGTLEERTREALEVLLGPWRGAGGRSAAAGVPAGREPRTRTP